MSQTDSEYRNLIGQVVILDTSSHYVYAGRLTALDGFCFVLEHADVHDLRDTSTTRELYVLDTRTHGVRANRKRVLIRRDEVVSLSLLSDVME